jgi:hypothetical protein
VANEFPLTPHVEAILKGRLHIPRDGGHIMCSADKCIFETEKADFGREIEVKGEAICQNCKAKVKYPEDLVFDEHSRHSFLKCPICKGSIPESVIKWTQWIVARHKRQKHMYYHKECHDKLYHECK